MFLGYGRQALGMEARFHGELRKAVPNRPVQVAKAQGVLGNITVLANAVEKQCRSCLALERALEGA